MQWCILWTIENVCIVKTTNHFFSLILSRFFSWKTKSEKGLDDSLLFYLHFVRDLGWPIFSNLEIEYWWTCIMFMSERVKNNQAKKLESVPSFAVVLFSLSIFSLLSFGVFLVWWEVSLACLYILWNTTLYHIIP